MKKRILSASVLLICVIVLIVLAISMSKKTSNKDNKKVFENNYSNEMISSMVDEDLVKISIKDSVLVFEPKNDETNDYVSIIAKTEQSTVDECEKWIEDYKEKLKENYKINDISSTKVSNIAFNTFQVFDSNGNIITVYGKSMSNDKYTILVTYFCGYSKDAKLQNALKDVFDSTKLK